MPKAWHPGICTRALLEMGTKEIFSYLAAVVAFSNKKGLTPDFPLDDEI